MGRLFLNRIHLKTSAKDLRTVTGAQAHANAIRKLFESGTSLSSSLRCFCWWTFVARQPGGGRGWVWGGRGDKHQLNHHFSAERHQFLTRSQLCRMHTPPAVPSPGIKGATNPRLLTAATDLAFKLEITSAIPRVSRVKDPPPSPTPLL